MSKSNIARFSLILFLFSLVACSPEKAAEPPAPSIPETTETARLNTWLDAEFEEYLDFSPMARSRLGDKSDQDKLDDVSEAADDARLAWRKASVAEMKAQFDREKLDDDGKLSYDLWVFMLERAEAGVPFQRYDYIFGRYGPQSGLPSNLISYHKVDEAADMAAYVSRLNQTGRYMRQYLTRAQAATADGIRAPYFDYERAIAEATKVITGQPFDDSGVSPLWEDITGKVQKLQDDGKVTEAEANKFRDDARAALLTEFKPAYDDIIAWLKDDLANNVPSVATGVWALPNGEAFYDYALSVMTTLPLTANEIHEKGLDEVARIHAEMETIKTQVGFKGTLAEFFVFMREDPQFYFPSTDEGREAFLELARGYLGEMQKKLPEYFGILPKAPLEVRRVEDFREQAGGAAHYMRGTADGSRPGVFYAHLVDMSANAKNRLEDLAYHEGLPGHHLQISVQQELEGIPKFRAFHGYTAFSEGWGLYAETLAKDMGFYTNPYNDFGRLTGELWRAVRLVVDTGIHSKKWTEQQAIDYAIANSPQPQSAAKSEIRRYFNNPGQATAYKIGQLKILELRAKAQSALGDKFDYRDFHDAVLGSGQLPLPVLEKKIDAWLE